MIERVQKQIVEPLNVAINGNDEDKNAIDTFPKVRIGIVELRRSVTAEGPLDARVADTRAKTDDARTRTDALIRRLIEILDKMEALKDINALIKDAQAILAEETRQNKVIEAMLRQLVEDAFK